MRMEENKRKRLRPKREQERKRQRERALPSTTVVASRRTLHSKVSTQRVCHERRRAVETLPPGPPTMPASLPADSCTPVIYFSPPHLTGRLLPITQGRGSALTARAPGQSAGFPLGHPLLLDPAYRGSIPRSAWHFNFHCWRSTGYFPNLENICKHFSKSNVVH